MSLTRQELGAEPSKLSSRFQKQISDKSLFLLWEEMERDASGVILTEAPLRWNMRLVGSLNGNWHFISGNFPSTSHPLTLSLLLLFSLSHITHLAKKTLDLGFFSLIFPSTAESLFIASFWYLYESWNLSPDRSLITVTILLVLICSLIHYYFS